MIDSFFQNILSKKNLGTHKGTAFKAGSWRFLGFLIIDRFHKLIQKGIDFFMDTLERTQAIEQNPKKEIVK